MAEDDDKVVPLRNGMDALISEEISTEEAMKNTLQELRSWAEGPKGGMGASLHWEKWPPLTPGARKRLLEIVNRGLRAGEAD